MSSLNTYLRALILMSVDIVMNANAPKNADSGRFALKNLKRFK